MRLKLSDKRFWEILRANGGLFSMTAKAIEKEFSISYSRQAVARRANSRPELLKDIVDEKLDLAESKLDELMQSQNEKTRMQAVTFYLERKGKNRGYTTRHEVNLPEDGQNDLPKTVIILNPHDDRNQA